jgi:hypothetical protein
MTVNWRPVVGYEGLYEVSDSGRVRSCDRRVVSYGGREYTRKGRDLAQASDKDGYKKVHLCKNGKSCHRTVHSLVLEAFTTVRDPGKVCRHLDGHPENNHLSNLSWGTPSENHQDCYDYGGTHGRGKLTREQVLEIASRLESGEKQADLAREYGVHFMNIHAIKTRKHFGYLLNSENRQHN